MGLLRRTTPVALAVGSAIGVLLATFQAIDGFFSNPAIVSSVTMLLAATFRVYFLYLISSLILLFLINLALCILFPKKMRDADYATLIEYQSGFALFFLILIFYAWKDQVTISDILHERHGVFPRLFFLLEIFGVTGIIAFILASATHQLVSRFPPGRLALYISSLAWFLLLFPLAGETALFLFGGKLHVVLQLIILVIIAFLISLLVRHLNRLTHALIALRRRTWIWFISTLALCAIIWAGISLMQPKPSNPPRSGDEINVVMISIDALRADHLGCYGYTSENPMIPKGEFSPNIDKFAKQGVLFENAFSAAPWTLASVSSWMTGGWPVETGGTYKNRRMYKAMTTLPEALKDEGYVSAAFNCNPFMTPATGLNRGFSKYWEFFDASKLATGLFYDNARFWLMKKLDEIGIKQSDREIVNWQLRETYGWLDKHKSDKFFLWVHLYDPHYPYTPPSPYREQLPDIGGEHRPPSFSTLTEAREGSSHLGYGARRHVLNLYDAELRFSDEMIGDILARLDQLDLSKDTLVVLTSDHGEEFFDHGGLEHGHTVYNEVLHVPLIFRLPGRIPEGKRVSDQMSLIDLFPTLLDFTGASVEPKLYRGESLKAAVMAGDMSLAGKGQMNLTPWAGGNGGNASGEEWGDVVDSQFPELEFEEGGKFSEPGFAIKPENEAPVEINDPVSAASDTLTNIAESRLGGPGGSPPSVDMPTGRVLFAEDLFYFDEDLKMIRIGDWKLIHSYNRFHDPLLLSGATPSDMAAMEGIPKFREGDELYNLAIDPYEIKNVIYDYPEIARYLYWKLKQIDYYDRREALTRDEVESGITYWGAGLKNLTKGFGYW